MSEPSRGEGDTPGAPEANDALKYLSALQVDILGRSWTIALSAALIVFGVLFIGISVVSWGAPETLVTSSSSITSTATTGSSPGAQVTCTGSISRITSDGGSLKAVTTEGVYPAPCPTPSGIPAGDDAVSSKTDLAPSPPPSIEAQDVDDGATPQAAEPPPTETAGEAAVPSAVLGEEGGGISTVGPTTVSRRHANFYLYLMFLGGAALLAGAFLPRVQSVKLGGLEVGFATTIPPALYTRLLRAISASDKPDVAKQAALRRLDTLARKVVGIRAVGRPARAGRRREPPLGSEERTILEELDFGGARPSVRGLRAIAAAEAAADITDEEVQELANVLLAEE